MRLFTDVKVLLPALVLAGCFAGCNPGPAISTLEGYVQSAKAALPGASVRLSPEEQKLFDRMSPEQQASFLRVLKAFREAKAEQAAAVERGTTQDIQTLHARSTEEEFRTFLLNHPGNTLGDR
jgi:hypothetical protein